MRDLLKSNGLQDDKPLVTPMASGRTLGKHDSVPMTYPFQYQKLVGALQYVTLTRLEISFSINKLYQFMIALLICIGL